MTVWIVAMQMVKILWDGNGDEIMGTGWGWGIIYQNEVGMEKNS